MGLTFERVRELFDYGPLTGVLRWRALSSPRSPIHIGDVAGSKNSEGYLQVKVYGRNYKAHRIIFLWMTGAWPKDKVDHKNLDKADNCWDNLREATNRQNSGNSPASKNNKCGFKGVCQRPSGRWEARISANGKLVQLGYHDTKEQAHAAYAKAAKRYFGEFARAA